jgi:hypothetical protein
MRRSVAVCIAIALTAVSCSSGAAQPDASSDVTELPADNAVTTTAAAVATTDAAAATTTTTEPAPAAQQEPSSSVAECVVGTWELESQRFFDDLLASMPPEEIEGEFTYVSGAYRLIVGSDGSFVNERDMWTFAVTSDLGDVEFTITDRQGGTYTLDANELSTVVEPSDPPEVTIKVDGEVLVVPGGGSPIAPPEAEFTGAVVTCEGDMMVASTEELSSYWTRQ